MEVAAIGYWYRVGGVDDNAGVSTGEGTLYVAKYPAAE